MLKDLLPKMASVGMLVRIDFPKRLLEKLGEMEGSGHDGGVRRGAGKDGVCCGCRDDGMRGGGGGEGVGGSGEEDSVSSSGVGSFLDEGSSSVSGTSGAVGAVGGDRGDNSIGLIGPLSAAASARGAAAETNRTGVGLQELAMLKERGTDLAELRNLMLGDRAAFVARLQTFGVRKLGDRLRLEAAIAGL